MRWGKSGDSKPLPRSFYERNTLDVAEDVIGKVLVFENNGHRKAARIVEVEAYVGEGDPACHAARGLTKRNAIMYGRGGFAYVYFIYGMYHCLNFVTEKKGFPAAVLVRSAEPVEGFEHLESSKETLLNGPGKLCRAFGLNLSHNGLDLTAYGLYLHGRDSSKTIVKTPRVGISAGRNLLWRFCDADSRHLSRLLKYQHNEVVINGQNK